MNANLRKQIVDHLDVKGTYDPDVDDFIIDELLENLALSKKALQSIKEEGIVIEFMGGNGFTTRKLNPMVNAFQMFQRNIHQCAIRLGISRKDRLNLKLIEDKKIDEFDEDFQ